jgi:hypothetical protein
MGIFEILHELYDLVGTSKRASAFGTGDRPLPTHTCLSQFLVDWPPYFVSCRLLNSSRKSELGESGHGRISTGDVSRIATDPPFSKMRQCTIDPIPDSRRRAEIAACIVVRPLFAPTINGNALELQERHDAIRRQRLAKQIPLCPSRKLPFPGISARI